MKNRNQCILYIHHTLNFRKPFNNFSVQHRIDCFECAHKVAEYREDTGKVFARLWFSVREYSCKFLCLRIPLRR